MTTYTWHPTSTVQEVNWNTPSDWLPAVVPDAADADVVMPLITSYGNPYPFYVTIDSNESYVVHSLTIVDQDLFIDGSLSVGGDLSVGAGTDIVLSNGSLAIGSLSNAAGIEIGGSGQISSGGSIDNQGEITGNGLTLDFAGLQNDGTLGAGGGSLEVDLTSGSGAFTNLSGGTLSLGTYEAGGGGVLDLNVGGDIVTDAATIILGQQEGTSLASIIETSGGAGGSAAPITQTLQTIAPTGVLTIQGMMFAGTTSLVDAGVVQLENGTLATSGLTIVSGGTVVGQGTITGPITDNGFLAVAASGDDLVLEGTVTGTGTIAFQALRAIGGTNTLEIAGAAVNPVAFADCHGDLVLDSPTLFSGPISGLTVGSEPLGYSITQYFSDAITLVGIDINAVTGLSYTGTTTAGTLTLETSGGNIALHFVGDYDTSDFVLAAGPQPLSTLPPSVVISEVLPCFLEGTRLMTDRGEVAVEHLAVGDRVRTPVSGGSAPVGWIGHRRVNCRRHPKPRDVWPVRITAGAFGANQPRRDLWLSPDHAVFFGGVLIPIRYLINGATIVQEQRDAVTYWHVELARHDVLLAEGLPAESYLDTGNRGAFVNGAPAMQMHPDFALHVWAAKSCAPLVLAGPRLVAAKRRLLKRAIALGHAMADDPGLKVLVEGSETLAATAGWQWRVRLPEATRRVRLASRVWVPAEMRPEEDDTRRLGVAVSRMWLDRREVSLESPALASGWQAPEPGWRWTGGDAGIALSGVRELAFEVAMTGTYWRNDGPGEARAARHA
jgi:hypothetical protein